MRIVIESPLSADTPEGFQRNYRFLLWCCRAAWLKEGAHAIGSHMLNPWFMEDTDEGKRAAGIANPWVWVADVEHIIFIDLGMSRGMRMAMDRCDEDGIKHGLAELASYHPESWAAFERGEWPPHAPGFELATVAK